MNQKKNRIKVSLGGIMKASTFITGKKVVQFWAFFPTRLSTVVLLNL